jgi:hypothetical protein
MKTKKFILLLGIGTLVAINFSTQAADQSASPSLSLLRSVPLAELPGKAAALVTAAKADSQIQTTVDVVKSAIGLNPAAAPQIVGSIAASAPDVAPVAAATAVSLLPKQAALLAQTAAAAAPKQAGKIVEAVCRTLPEAYKAVAEAVAAAVPGASKEILAGIAAAIPSLKDAISSALAIYKGATPSINSVLAQVGTATDPVTLAAGSPHGGPVTGPPYVPLPGVSTPIDPGASGNVPTGGRQYSSPATP